VPSSKKEGEETSNLQRCCASSNNSLEPELATIIYDVDRRSQADGALFTSNYAGFFLNTDVKSTQGPSKEMSNYKKCKKLRH
jgi:hypothetical protein